MKIISFNPYPVNKVLVIILQLIFIKHDAFFKITSVVSHNHIIKQVQSLHKESESHLASSFTHNCYSPNRGLCTNISHCYFHQMKNNLRAEILVTKQVSVIIHHIEFSGNSASGSQDLNCIFFLESNDYLIILKKHQSISGKVHIYI